MSKKSDDQLHERPAAPTEGLSEDEVQTFKGDKTLRRVNDNIEKHALAAQVSQYDRTVAITAIARARALIEKVSLNSDSGNLGVKLHSALVELHANYNDPDGVYTNGKGVLGSLISDIEIELNKAHR